MDTPDDAKNTKTAGDRRSRMPGCCSGGHFDMGSMKLKMPSCCAEMMQQMMACCADASEQSDTEDSGDGAKGCGC